jgi:hypothetical protein
MLHRCDRAPVVDIERPSRSFEIEAGRAFAATAAGQAIF